SGRAGAQTVTGVRYTCTGNTLRWIGPSIAIPTSTRTQEVHTLSNSSHTSVATGNGTSTRSNRWARFRNSNAAAWTISTSILQQSITGWHSMIWHARSMNSWANGTD